MTFAFGELRRSPDVEAPNLYASDAADRLILDTASDSLTDASEGEVVVIGDRYGALTLGAAAQYGARGLRACQDPLSGERALAANAARFGLAGAYRSLGLGSELLTGARVVLLRLPRSLDELSEIADTVSRFAPADVTVYAGGMVKHLTLAMNDILARHFGSVRAGLARGKARVLTAGGGPTAQSCEAVSRAEAGSWPRREFHADLDLWLCAHGSAFAGTRVDVGTRFLLGFLDQAKPDATSAIDLGCGTGLIAAAVAKARPEIVVLATDQSAGSVASAAATMLANGLSDRVTVVRDDALSAQREKSAELILLNPPFHLGSSVHAGAAIKLFEDSARVLAPGGELWTVWNSHLGYRGVLARLIGPTRQVGRNRKFTVTVSTRRPDAARASS